MRFTAGPFSRSDDSFPQSDADHKDFFAVFGLSVFGLAGLPAFTDAFLSILNRA